jgi:glycosyltransferase involved in cell wall biosynthesis
MSSTPFISVVITVFNCRRYIGETIQSVLDQRYPHREIVVVDDGSTDGTRDILSQYEKDIRCIYQANRGVAAARNRGIAQSKGDFIALLDHDDLWVPDKLERQVAHSQQYPDAGLYHTDVLYWHMGTGVKERREGIRKEFTGDCYLKLFWKHHVTPSTVLIRKACFDRAGLFDEGLRYVDDWDLWQRIAQHYPFAYLDEPLVIYRFHETNASRNTIEMEQYSLRCVEQSLRRDPSLYDRIGRPAINRQLFMWLFRIGYLCFEAGRHREAHEHFARALKCCPSSVHTRLLWLATLLPPRATTILRQVKQTLGLRFG